MDTFNQIIFYTLLGSIVSLGGGVLLLSKVNLARRISHYLSSFAAGVMLGAAFIDLLPEALEHAEELNSEINIFLWTLGGILIFFLLERIIHNFHHHGTIHSKAEIDQDKKSTIPLIVLGDSFHNFIDGVVIAATFLVDVRLGMLTAFAVAAHEIPQEIGDFGLLLHRGLSRMKVISINFFSALAALLGAILTFLIGESIEGILPIFLALASGFFIYISLSNLIPEIHGEDRKGVAFWETVLLFVGVFVVWYVLSLLEGLAPH